jgi:hypothetical protein
MNREGAKDAKEKKEEDAVLTSRSGQIRGLIIPMQPYLVSHSLHLLFLSRNNFLIYCLRLISQKLG